MARELRNMKLEVECDDQGTPQSAQIAYEVWDGNAKKSGVHAVSTPDFDKPLHDQGQAGEFWFDEVELIKATESIV